MLLSDVSRHVGDRWCPETGPEPERYPGRVQDGRVLVAQTATTVVGNTPAVRERGEESL